MDTPVARTFLFNFPDQQAADFAGSGDMGAAAGLQVDTRDLEQTDTTDSARRFYGHGPDEFRALIEFVFRDPAGFDFVIGSNQFIECLCYRLFIHSVLHIKIQAALFSANRATGDPVTQYGTEQVKRRVHTHMSVSTIPVENRCDYVIGHRQSRFFCRDVQDDTAGPLTCVDNGYIDSGLRTEKPGVTRLSAA